MSADKLKRRQFLADALFAGGALGAAALAARYLGNKPPEPEPKIMGKVAPVHTPTPEPTGICAPVEPNVDGGARPLAPGQVVAPQTPPQQTR
ncbi:hypothetical protein DYH09_34675 [bacterium CPR1]|nr:hypothetical protein [bacterium CPR1]